MVAENRRAREREQRRELIIATARAMAEADGWESVTVRGLAERIEYSQPVLYGHFENRGAIIDAVALQGIGELAVAMNRARLDARGEPELKAVARAYLDFAAANPALFDAMFSRAEGLQFGDGAPEQLKAAFAEIYAVFAPLAGDRDPETFTETGWSAIHGLAALDRDGRLRPGRQAERLDLLVRQFLAA